MLDSLSLIRKIPLHYFLTYNDAKINELSYKRINSLSLIGETPFHYFLTYIKQIYEEVLSLDKHNMNLYKLGPTNHLFCIHKL